MSSVLAKKFSERIKITKLTAIKSAVSRVNIAKRIKFTLILKEFRFVQRVVGVQRAKPLVALRRERNSLN